MARKQFAILTSLILCASVAASDVTHVEGFDDGNPSNWRFLPLDATTFIAGSGGNPGHYLTHTQTSWPWPTLRTVSADSPFTGDWREKNVTAAGLDMIVPLAQAQPHPDFTVTMMLVRSDGASGNPNTETRVYFNSGQSIPWPGQGWRSYDFNVPSQLDPPMGQLPPGWKYWEDQFGSTFANHSWREVMEKVDEVWFVGINDPAGFGFLLNWISGVDNMRITFEAPSVPGDLNGDGSVGVPDLLLLLAAWGTCDDLDDCPADLNGDGVVGVADLLILLAHWG